MRKILVVLFLFASCFTFGQDFARATYYEFGFVDTLTQEVVWSDKVKMDPTLVSMGSRNLRIHTEKFQQYIYKSQKYDLYEVKGYYYKSYSVDGEECVIYFYTEDDGSNYIEIEHNSYIIKYSLVELEQ